MPNIRKILEKKVVKIKVEGGSLSYLHQCHSVGNLNLQTGQVWLSFSHLTTQFPWNTWEHVKHVTWSPRTISFMQCKPHTDNLLLHQTPTSPRPQPMLCLQVLVSTTLQLDLTVLSQQPLLLVFVYPTQYSIILQFLWVATLFLEDIL